MTAYAKFRALRLAIDGLRARADEVTSTEGEEVAEELRALAHELDERRAKATDDIAKAAL